MRLFPGRAMVLRILRTALGFTTGLVCVGAVTKKLTRARRELPSYKPYNQSTTTATTQASPGVATLIDPIADTSRLIELEPGVVMTIPPGYDVVFVENGTLGVLQDMVFGSQSLGATD